MPFQKGQSGNPGGRMRVPPEVKGVIHSNGVKAVNRMAIILDDDSAFGRNGWIPPKDQLAVLEKAQDRAFGKSENLNVSHSHKHEGTIEAKAAQPAIPSLKNVQNNLPEKMAQEQVIDAKVVGGN